MANPKAKAEIILEDKTGQGIQSALKSLKSLEGGFGGLKNTMTLFKGLAAVGIFKEIIKECRQLVDEFVEVEKVGVRFRAAFKDTGDTSSYKKMVDDFARSSFVAKNDIKGLVGELGMLGKSEKDIKRLTEASLSLSQVTGQGVNESFKQLNSILTTGKVPEEIGKLIPELKSFSEEANRNGESIDTLTKNFKNFKEQVGGSAALDVKKFRESLAELRQTTGEMITNFFRPIMNALTEMFDKINEVISKRNELFRTMNSPGSSTTQEKLNLNYLALGETRKAMAFEKGKQGYVSDALVSRESDLIKTIQGLTIQLQQEAKAAVQKEDDKKAQEESNKQLDVLKVAFQPI